MINRRQFSLGFARHIRIRVAARYDGLIHGFRFAQGAERSTRLSFGATSGK